MHIFMLTMIKIPFARVYEIRRDSNFGFWGLPFCLWGLLKVKLFAQIAFL